MNDLATTAPAFVDIAHEIVWASVATVDPQGRARSRVLHPIWEWDGTDLTGWIATNPSSPKRAHIDANPSVSCSYWAPSHDACVADCTAEWVTEDADVAAVWDRFSSAPLPLGYDPTIIPGWDSPASPNFGALKLTPWRLFVMPGSLMLTGQGERLIWHA